LDEKHRERASVITPDPLAGTNYQVHRTVGGEPVVLGAGGVGIVFEAVVAASGEHVAVKVLRPDLAADDSIRERALREANRLANLDYHCIVKFREAGETATGLPFIAMELLKGRTLAQRVQAEGPISPRPAVWLMLQVLEGLWFMHSRGVIHRDLKLDNIFLCDDSKVKILDVGLAKELRHQASGVAESSLTSKGTIIGTPRYMSPEQASGLRADERSDVYTAAYIFYTMISGRLPFEQYHEARDLLLAHAIRPAEPPSRHLPGLISENLDAVVMKALEKDPADRFQTAQQFARALYRTVLSEDAAHAEARGSPPSSALRRSLSPKQKARLLQNRRAMCKLLIFLTISVALTASLTRIVAWVVVRSSP